MGGRFFRLGNALITYALALFIVATVGAVLVRGVPGIPAALKSPELLFALRLSLFTSLVSTVLAFFVALPAAYSLARGNLPGGKIVADLLRIPLNLPPIASGVALLLFFGTTRWGRALANLGLEFVFTVPGIILAQFFVNVPALITVLKGALETTDQRLENVARTLGCTPAQAFLRVTLPLIRNSVLAGLILTWGKALGEFGAVLMLAGATRFKTETLPVSLYLSLATGDLEALLATASLLILIALFSLAMFERARIKLDERGTIL
ncbi:MAG: ABC transporter permease [Firmicutes bacterium]|nr:ABC transporter permease [Bacillota bacterium]